LDQLLAIAAGVALVVVLWRAFRFAMVLRYSKLEREASQRRVEAGGRRIIAEIPLESGAIELLTADSSGFHWLGEVLSRDRVAGARLLLNGGIMKEARRSGFELPAPVEPEEFEGRERWQVNAYLDDGEVFGIECGRLREGVSREAALLAFDAVKGAFDPAQEE
jgi:hypothetical protein